MSFKDFFQYAVPTRVIAGRGLLPNPREPTEEDFVELFRRAL